MGSVSSIETMSCVDGPGIRIVIFLNGCKKRCLFCHNPEMFTMKKDNMTELELVNKIKRYKTYFGKKGGVTFSGGEPLLQTDFLIKVLKELKKENINVAIETSGDYLGDIDELLKYTDIIILDIKDTRNEEYKYLTTQDISVQENFIKIINNYNLKVHITQVIIPGINDNLDYMKSLKEYLKKIKNVEEVKFLPYHRLGIEKYQKLNIPYKLNIDDMSITKCNDLYKKFQELYICK